MNNHYDVLIIGAGLAGLSLARHLELTTDKRILLLDKKSTIPPKRQKLGESMVQVGGYYFSKVLDMDEHLHHEHFMKYNLRMHWKAADSENTNIEDYSQAYIRGYSNIPSFQIDRNVFENELLQSNLSNPQFHTAFGISQLQVELKKDGPHQINYVAEEKNESVTGDWVVDTTGRGRLLTRQMKTHQGSSIHHGASFMWVDGLVNIERLTDRSLQERRLDRSRHAKGHLPAWMATNHFMGEGFWVWLIPLRGKTSIGVVYDNACFDPAQVSSAEKLRDWLCREYPLFARDLNDRRIDEFSAMKEFSYGCRETINPDGWAMSGESSRFTDPLYSPGCDFIALHNTLIVDAITTESRRELQRKCWLYEMLMQAMYESLLPSYTASYNTLGDQETFVLKYSWELSVYFSFFVFPFINDLHTNIHSVSNLLSQFSRLGPMNHAIQDYLRDYYIWKSQNAKKQNRHSTPGVNCHDFTDLQPLQRAAQTFYQVGVSPSEAKAVLSSQIENLRELAKFIVAHISSIVANDPSLLHDAGFIGEINIEKLKFDPDAIQKLARRPAQPATHCWSFDTCVFNAFARNSAGDDQPVIDEMVSVQS